jgi:hypothetical protein
MLPAQRKANLARLLKRRTQGIVSKRRPHQPFARRRKHQSGERRRGDKSVVHRASVGSQWKRRPDDRRKE